MSLAGVARAGYSSYGHEQQADDDYKLVEHIDSMY